MSKTKAVVFLYRESKPLHREIFRCFVRAITECGYLSVCVAPQSTVARLAGEPVDVVRSAGPGGEEDLAAAFAELLDRFEVVRLISTTEDDVLVAARFSWTIEEELTRAANARPRNPKPGNTRALDDYGLPTITVPCGFSKSGLPIGLQISAANWREADALALAHAFQSATDWHTRRPSLTADTKVPALSKTAAAQTGEFLTR